MRIDNDWERVESLLSSALELPVADREKFLDQACGKEGGIRAEVESLLSCEVEAEGFLANDAISFSRGLLGPGDGLNSIGPQIGRYNILREVGRGGMGTVYLAERTVEGVQQSVALKLVKREINTPEIRRRFSHERQILSTLEHPQITRLLDLGSTEDGVPFFVMEYVDGVPINQYANTRKLSITEVLTLFRKVCDGVAYAHRKLVVHRDLKPSNILVTTDGTPKLLDFGIAKLSTPEFEASSEHTVTQLGAMSLRYASPEQVRASPVSTATDIYSLAVVLYELLTGVKLYNPRNESRIELARAICEDEPRKPSEATGPSSAGSQTDANQTTRLRNLKSLRGDLDNIVLKALRKEPERRYASVEEFSEDIRRHLEGLPVTATKDTFGYRTGKFIRRHKTSVAATLLILLAIGGGFAATAWQARVARAQRDRARIEQAKAERINSFMQDMLGAAAPEIKGSDVKVVELLSEASRRAKVELADNQEVLAGVLTTLGRTYISLAQYDAAEHDLRAAVEAGLHASGGSETNSVAIALSWLGLVLSYQDKSAEGEQVSRRAVGLQRQLHPEGHPDLGIALYSLGANMTTLGQPKAAIPFLEEAEQVIKKHFGESHGYHMAVLGMLGVARERAGDVSGAEQAYRQSLTLGQQVEPRFRIFIGQSSLYLGALLINKGNYDEAETLLRDSEKIYRESSTDSNVGIVKANLGLLYLKTGNFNKAEVELREALSIVQKDFPPEHNLVLSNSSGLGLALTRVGKAKEAERYLRETLAIRKRVLSPGDYRIALTESFLGECLAAQKRFDEAEELLLRSYQNLKASFGESDTRTVDARARLVRLYEGWRKPEHAEKV